MSNTELENTRRANLRAVINERGGPAAVARVLKLSGPSWLSQLTHGHRPFNEKTARKYERGLGLKPGWLDQAHDLIQGMRKTNDSHKVNSDVELVSQTVNTVNSLLTTRGEKLSTAQFGSVVDLVFSLSVSLGKVDDATVEKILNLFRME